MVYDFIYNVWFFYNGYDGNGREKPRKVYIHENKEKIPRLITLSPRHRL